MFMLNIHCGKNDNKKIKIGTVGGVMPPNLKEKCKILVWMLKV